ncbi:TPA: hypothetical protein ACH3X2_012206 [Trebouxia sp. C0005]
MPAAKRCHQVWTSFRSVSGMTGTELAGTSGPQQLFRGALGGAQRFLHVINKFRAQISTSGDGTHLSASFHKCSKHPLHSNSWSPKLLLGQQAVLHSRPFVTNSHNGLAQKRHQTLISQASSRSVRHYYSSGYSRGYGSYWDGDKVLYSLIAANCAGFFLWQSDPTLIKRHAIVSVNSIREGRIYTLLTSAFSHASLNHIFANMFTFYFFGREIGLTFGGKKLLALYVAGGIAGSLAHVAFFYFKAQSTGTPQDSVHDSSLCQGFSSQGNLDVMQCVPISGCCLLSCICQAHVQSVHDSKPHIRLSTCAHSVMTHHLALIYATCLTKVSGIVRLGAL